MRTSKFAIFVRAVAIVFVIYMLLAWAWNSVTLSNTFTAVEMFISALLTVVLFGGFAWLMTNLGMAVLFGKNSEYKRMKNNGFDPYFDSIPWPLNSDSKITRETGIQEPNTNFVPPDDWRFQCPSCGARVKQRIDVCWNCNYGADGDSSIYLQKFGVERPAEMSEKEWAEVRRKSGR